MTPTHFEDDATRWQAVLTRDRAAEGAFYYAVSSTGIYCRPTCASKRPKPENVAFYPSPEAAEQAGYRPCKRCRPDEVSRPQEVVARVQHLLETSEPTPSLAELGAAVGLSPAYVQRLFKRVTGLSPKRYAAALKAERLGAHLRGGESVTRALYEAGYGSSRALYDQAGTQLGMKPGSYKNGGVGETISYGLAESPLGPVLVAATEWGVCALRFGKEVLEEVRAEFPAARLEHDPQAVAPFLEAVLSYLAGQQRALALPLDVRPSAFQARVWEALRAIPYGETRTYSQIAEAIGAPKAVRAVARACATNPVALAIPCHRVVRAGGALSGYRWGTQRKRALLEAERQHAGAGSSRML